MLSTTTRINHKINAVPPSSIEESDGSGTGSSCIELILDADFLNGMPELVKNHLSKSRKALINDKLITHKKLEDLENDFKLLSKAKISTEAEKICIEKYKLAIMKAVQFHLEKNFGEKITKKTQKINQQLSGTRAWLNKQWYYATRISVQAMAVIGNFIGSIELLRKIPNITNIFLYGPALVLSLVECGLHYAVMAPAIRKAFGISSKSTMKITPLDFYARQLTATENVSKMLVSLQISIDRINIANYRKFSNIAKLFNKSIDNLDLGKYEISDFKKMLGWILGGFNILFAVTGGYFLGNALVTSLAIVSAPVSWVIICCMTALMVHNHLKVRTSNVHDILNPDYAKFTRLEERLNNFEMSNRRLDNILAKEVEKHRLHYKNIKRNISKKMDHPQIILQKPLPTKTIKKFEPKLTVFEPKLTVKNNYHRSYYQARFGLLANELGTQPKKRQFLTSNDTYTTQASREVSMSL